MKVFLSHTTVDKEIVEAIGRFLTKRGLDVWIDSWVMTAGDSLVAKISEGIQESDRLVVCLTPNSVESNWVKKEVSTGIVMELAEEKGFGEKFVVPALLIPCKVPTMLRDKLYANFTNKSFESACEELLAGITNAPTGSIDKKFENRIVRSHTVASSVVGKYVALVEFAVRISPTDGLHVGINFGAPFSSVLEWFAPPNQSLVPSNTGGVYTDSATRNDGAIYARKFSSPSVTSTKSFYIKVEGDKPFQIKEVQFLDHFDREP